MTPAYDKLYLDKAQTALGRMLDFAVCELRFSLSDFFDLFLASGIAARFERGDFGVTVGVSGVELAYLVLENVGLPHERIAPRYAANRSPEYWTGWALAYYQWQTALRFSDIVRAVPIEEIRLLYTPYHEMDIRHFCDEMHRLCETAWPETNLKRLRTNAGLTQRELAEAASVPLRTLQQYEQRQKNINKAQAAYLMQISRVLHCEIEDLLERE